MATSIYLPAPAFGLAWYGDGRDGAAFTFLPGGGGSSKTGVKNQIMIGSIKDNASQVQLLTGFLTDTETRNNFVSGISRGRLFGTDVVCALVANKCIIYEVIQKGDGFVSFKQRGEVAAPAEGEESDLNCSLVTKSGLVVAGGDGKIVHVWEAVDDTGKEQWEGESLFNLKHHQAPIAALCEHPFSNWICSAGKDGACKIWSLSNGQMLLDIPALVDGVFNPNPKLSWESKGCAFNADGTCLYSMQCTRRGPTYLIKWELETKGLGKDKDQSEKRVYLAAHAGKIKFLSKFAASKLAVSEDGSHIAVGASDGRLLVCDSSDMSVVHDVLCHDFPITGVAFAPTALVEQADLTAIVATCSADRKLNIIRVGKKTWLLRLLQFLLVLMIMVIIAILLLATLNLHDQVLDLWRAKRA